MVSFTKPHPKVPAWEQELSAGASAMNIVTAATALGYGANWLTGWFAFDRDVLDGLGLKADEKLAGFIHIGTPAKASRGPPAPGAVGYRDAVLESDGCPGAAIEIRLSRDDGASRAQFYFAWGCFRDFVPG